MILNVVVKIIRMIFFWGAFHFFLPVNHRGGFGG